MPVEAVRPYLMDLGSTNGTFINNERLEPQRFYELLEKVNLNLNAAVTSRVVVVCPHRSGSSSVVTHVSFRITVCLCTWFDSSLWLRFRRLSGLQICLGLMIFFCG